MLQTNHGSLTMAYNQEPQHVKHDTMLTKHITQDVWYIEERYGERRTVLEVHNNLAIAQARYERYLKATYCVYKRKCAECRTTICQYLIPDEESRITVTYDMNSRVHSKPRASRSKHYIPEDPL